MGSADELPRAEHALHRLRRSPRRPLPLLPRPGAAVEPLRHPLRRRHGPHVRRLQPAAGQGHRSRAGHGAARPRRLRLRLPPGHPGQGARCGARRAAGRVAVERGHLRHRAGVRAAAAAHALAPAARGPALRRPDAARAAQGHPELPAARRPARSRRSTGPRTCRPLASGRANWSARCSPTRRSTRPTWSN